jgi:hypothetical protein
MAIANSSFQTTATDTILPNDLLGKVTRLDVQDPTENNEKTSLIEPDDPTDVVVDWTLQGLHTPVVGGTWEVTLYIDDIDGVGPTSGQLGPTLTVPVTTGPGSPPVPQGPVTFHVGAGAIGDGVYQLVVTINHHSQLPPSPGGLTEMVGFAESTPIKVTRALVEIN